MRRTELLWIAGCSVFVAGCSTTGRTVLSKEMDTGSRDPESSSSDIPTQPEYTTWEGQRTIVFPDLCEFTITETGNRLIDPERELVQLISSECPLCQVYEIENSPEFVECGDIGTLETGGLRYRVLSFTEQYADGTLNVSNGTVELWHAIEPLWQLDYIADALFNNDADSTDTHQWLYEANSNFQAFRYTEISTFTLSSVP